jgi:hypothetical protein
MPECAAQMDGIVGKYSEDVIERALKGVFWGLHTNPKGYEKVWGNIRIAKTRSLGLENMPMLRLLFEIGNEGKSDQTDDEPIIMRWIEEIDALDEIMDENEEGME